ncbi:hypothetical protein CLL_A1786 [Clostridium botulinum B str. Eklund 17B (NRP)]|uniref:Uncharacterized protein n=1 Tax=Clostridium botulinum (strain Eklund 17B / Type B) TaxID=935198 RepID=B2TI86_CLOBB|nr:hypothetical protein CLL_A1786 [Clostridium botulinum B str. Eklund 17B (NRP)]
MYLGIKVFTFIINSNLFNLKFLAIYIITYTKIYILFCKKLLIYNIN